MPEDTKKTKAIKEWRKTFDAISDCVSVHDSCFRFLKANQALAELTGKSERELIGRHCYQIIHGTDSPYKNCPHRKALESSKTVTEEIYEPNLQRHLLVTCTPFFDENDQLAGSVHVSPRYYRAKTTGRIFTAGP